MTLRKRASRGGLTLSALALTGALILAGCGGSGTGSPSTDDETGNGQPVAGGSLVVGDDSQPLSGLDPIMAQAWNAKRFAAQFYEGLLTLDQDGQTLKPALATEWEQVSDTRYEFTLREGVTFHDGSELTADDVVFSLERIVDPDQNSPYMNLFSFDTITAEGPDKVVIELTRPQSSLLHLLAQPWSAGIVKKDWIQAKSVDELKTQENGTGPYKLVEFREGSIIKTQAFEDYWESGKPYIQEVDYRVFQDESTRVQALQSGSIDMVHIKLPRNRDVLEKAGMDVGPIYNVGSWWMGLNAESGPLANEQVRQAISMGLDREQLIQVGSQGVGQLAGVVPPADPLGPEIPADYPNYEYDPDRAKQLIEESGEGPVQLKLALQSEVETLIPTAELLKSQLAEIGVDLQIQQVPFAQLVTNLLSGDWDADMIQLTAALNADASQYLDLWFGEGKPSTKVDDPELWQMMDDAVHAATDNDDRASRYAEINEYIAEKAYMIVPFASPLAIDIWSDRVHGFFADSSGTRIFLKEAWVTGN